MARAFAGAIVRLQSRIEVFYLVSIPRSEREIATQWRFRPGGLDNRVNSIPG
jgi:hypothetical protein